MNRVHEQENQKKYEWPICTVKDGHLTNFKVKIKTMRAFLKIIFAYFISKDEQD